MLRNFYSLSVEKLFQIKTLFQKQTCEKNSNLSTELKTYAIIMNDCDILQIVESSLRMQEVRGTIPRISKTSVFP